LIGGRAARVGATAERARRGDADRLCHVQQQRPLGEAVAAASRGGREREGRFRRAGADQRSDAEAAARAVTGLPSFDRPDREEERGMPERELMRLPQGVVLVDSTLLVDYANPAAERLLGVASPGVPLPDPWPEFSLRGMAARQFGLEPPAGGTLVETNHHFFWVEGVARHVRDRDRDRGRRHRARAHTAERARVRRKHSRSCTSTPAKTVRSSSSSESKRSRPSSWSRTSAPGGGSRPPMAAARSSSFWRLGLTK